MRALSATVPSDEPVTAAGREKVGSALPQIAETLEAACRRIDTLYEGRRVVWRIWGSGKPLILLHGGFGSWTHWVRNIGPLSARNKVIAPDMPGFGLSDSPADTDLLRVIPGALLAGLPAVLDGAARFNLAGFSFGSVMAGQVAAELGAGSAPFAVDCLALVAPAALGVAVADFTSLARIKPGMTQAEIASVHRHNMSIMLFKNSTAIDDTAVSLQIVNTSAARAWGRSYSRSDALVKAADRIRAPRMLAIWGNGDAYAHRNLAAYEAAVARLRADIEVHRIADAGHWVQYEAADAFNAVLSDAVENEAIG